MKAADLRCAGAAQRAAEALERQFPGIDFTSGRRGVIDQARAMSQNVVRNRRWIAQTYTATAESRALQEWVDAHPEADATQEIAAGLAALMMPWSDDQKGRVSKHFAGLAFDIRPENGARGKSIKSAIRATVGLDKFLEKEGGLTVWHAQYRA